MAVAVIIDFEGGTLDQYDQVIENMGFTRGGDGAPASVFHWVARSDSGIRVVDVWESREAFDRFAQEEIGPKTQEVGMSPPQMQFYEVHNTLNGVPSS